LQVLPSLEAQAFRPLQEHAQHVFAGSVYMHDARLELGSDLGGRQVQFSVGLAHARQKQSALFPRFLETTLRNRGDVAALCS
jgi:hypothetical protein